MTVRRALDGSGFVGVDTTTTDAAAEKLLTQGVALLSINESTGAPTQISATNPLPVASTSGTEYETVAASQTAQVMGATGATGDFLEGLLVVPASTSPGVVTILDNATSINVFAGGASSLTGLVPFYIYLGVKSVSGAWKVTTGANVSVIATGDFT